jgi:hypothetical protein
MEWISLGIQTITECEDPLEPEEPTDPVEPVDTAEEAALCVDKVDDARDETAVVETVDDTVDDTVTGEEDDAPTLEGWEDGWDAAWEAGGFVLTTELFCGVTDVAEKPCTDDDEEFEEAWGGRGALLAVDVTVEDDVPGAAHWIVKFPPGPYPARYPCGSL